MDKNLPILKFYNEKSVTTPEKFVDLDNKTKKNIELVKSKKIKKCLLYFLDDAENNETLKKYKVIYKCHLGSIFTPVFLVDNILVAISPAGAPAGAVLMEELSLFGVTNFIAVGSAGYLKDDLKNKFVLVDKAIRDEGVSYHYLPASTYVETSKSQNLKLADNLKNKNIDFDFGTTWTTDAFYMESPSKIEEMRLLGAVAVEMEGAGYCAVAKYKNFEFSQILFFSDLVLKDLWKKTEIHSKKDLYYNDYRNKILNTFIEIVKEI